MARAVRVRDVSYASRVEAEWGIYLKMLGYVGAEHEPFFVDGRLLSSGGSPSYAPDFWVPTGGFESLTGVIVEVKRGRVDGKDLAKWSHLMRRLEAGGHTASGGTPIGPKRQISTGIRFVAVEGAPPGLWHFAPRSSGECEDRRVADVWSYGPPPIELLHGDQDLARKARAYVGDHGVDAQRAMPLSDELDLWISKLVAQMQLGC